jgi:DHA1 family tetracycline resistance protein-like MFS transporter
MDEQFHHRCVVYQPDTGWPDGWKLTVAQAYIADITDEKNRARSMGIIGAAFGLGFFIGPATGGLLSKWGFDIPAFTAAAVSFLNLSLIYFLLPESLVGEVRESARNRQKPRLP